jgi:5-methylcytosine-specific restriction endonuclease McrA
MGNQIKPKTIKPYTCGKNKGNNKKLIKNSGLSKKNNIPKKIREEVWKYNNGNIYESACKISWCTNIIDVFNYHVGHDIPESKGGNLDIINLKPICSSCNLSMGNRFTITDWDKIGINERDKIYKLKLFLKISFFLLGTISLAFIGLYNTPGPPPKEPKIFGLF